MPNELDEIFEQRFVVDPKEFFEPDTNSTVSYLHMAKRHKDIAAVKRYIGKHYAGNIVYLPEQVTSDTKLRDAPSELSYVAERIDVKMKKRDIRERRPEL